MTQRPVDADRPGDLFSPDCPTRIVVDRVARKWVVMAVKLLAEAPAGELRFAELERGMRGVSHKMLAQTLRDLTRDGLVTRRVEPAVPPRTYYALTDLGSSLAEPLAALRAWAETHVREVDGAWRLADAHEAGDAPGA